MGERKDSTLLSYTKTFSLTSVSLRHFIYIAGLLSWITCSLFLWMERSSEPAQASCFFSEEENLVVFLCCFIEHRLRFSFRTAYLDTKMSCRFNGELMESHLLGHHLVSFLSYHEKHQLHTSTQDIFLQASGQPYESSYPILQNTKRDPAQPRRFSWLMTVSVCFSLCLFQHTFLSSYARCNIFTPFSERPL